MKPITKSQQAALLRQAEDFAQHLYRLVEQWGNAPDPHAMSLGARAMLSMDYYSIGSEAYQLLTDLNEQVRARIFYGADDDAWAKFRGV